MTRHSYTTAWGTTFSLNILLSPKTSRRAHLRANGLADEVDLHAWKGTPLVRPAAALSQEFEGWAMAWEGEPVKSIKTGLWRACDRGSVARCSSYSFRHTAARWMRRSGVPPWEVAAQLGHSVGKDYAITERYAFYSPDYLSKAVEALDALIRLVADRPVTGQSDEKSEQCRSSSGVEQRIRNAWAGGSNPSCGTNENSIISII
jgi:hypothetical protein